MATPLGLTVLVSPHVNQQVWNSVATAQGINFATKTNQAIAKAGQPLGKITGQVSEFEKSMAAANARVLAFGASAGTIYKIGEAFNATVANTINVEKALADINVVLGLGQTNLKSFSTEMFKAAAQTGQTFETASKVALEFARHGVSASETTMRMSSAMQLMRISGLSAEESVNAITAAINAFNKEGLTSEDIVNRLTAVDTKFAVSSQDLAKAIERVGSSAVDAGVRFNELLGLITSVQTTTARGGAVIGNAFKSIFTRLARPEVLSDLESIGITTKNTSGQILPMIDILKRLASQYDNLNYAQKSFVAEAVGGVYQVNILKASLADLGHGFSIYDKATLAASQSVGMIDKRMTTLNETISSKLNTSMVQFTRLSSSFGQIAMGGNAKSGIDTLNKQMDAFASVLDEPSEGAGTGEKIGKGIAQGIVKGLGDIVSGPGIQMAAALITQLTKKLAKFSVDSAKGIMGNNENAKNQAVLQQHIGEFLGKNLSILDELVAGQINLNDVTQIYLKHLQTINTLEARKAKYSSAMAPIIMGSTSFNSSKPVTPAGGLIPSFGIPHAAQEYAGAIAGGYKPGKIHQEFLKGVGNVTMNSAETIKQFPGMAQAAIMPPSNSKAGRNYRQKFQTIHGFNPYAAQGFVPNLSLADILGGLGNLGSVGAKMLPRQHLPADISKEKLEEIFHQYAKAMYNPAAGKIPIGINQFANRAFNSAYVEKNGNYIFGQHDDKSFLATHFAPKTKVGGFGVIKDMKEYDNIIFAVTQDLSAMLKKIGYSTLKEGVPVSYRGGEATKDIMVSNMMRAPILGAGMFSALMTGNAKDYFMAHGGRADKAQRSDLYWGDMGRMHNIVPYMKEKGLIAASGVIPEQLPIDFTKKGSVVYDLKKHWEKVNALSSVPGKQKEYSDLRSSFYTKSHDVGFTLGEYRNSGFFDSIFAFNSIKPNDILNSELSSYSLDFNKLEKNNISRRDLLKLASRGGKIYQDKYSIKSFNSYGPYNVEKFQESFKKEKKISSVKKALTKEMGGYIDSNMMSTVEYMMGYDLSDLNYRSYAQDIQQRFVARKIYGTEYGNVPSNSEEILKKGFKKGSITKINQKLSQIFGLEGRKHGNSTTRSFFPSEREFLFQGLFIKKSPLLGGKNLGLSQEYIDSQNEDPLILKKNKRKIIEKHIKIGNCFMI